MTLDSGKADPAVDVSTTVRQVVQTLQQIKTLPPPASMSWDLLAIIEILGEDPEHRRPLGRSGTAVVQAWSEVAKASRAHEIVRGSGQVALARRVAPHEPAIRVSDGLGRPVAGVTVKFEVEPKGNGSVQDAEHKTDQSGVASPGAWTLGKEGVNTLRATIEGAEEHFRAVAV